MAQRKLSMILPNSIDQGYIPLKEGTEQGSRAKAEPKIMAKLNMCEVGSSRKKPETYRNAIKNTNLFLKT